MTSTKMAAGATFPDRGWPVVAGDPIRLAQEHGWRLLVVYRGKHCPICKVYLNALEGLREEWEQAGVSVTAISADRLEQAAADVEKHGWSFRVAYGLGLDDMRALGLYVSEPRSPAETDHKFPEPAVFVINPENRAQVIDISNAPFARPDLRTLLGGIKYVQANNYPIRGAA